MATVAKKPEKRRIVRGIEHGLSGYTNYGCKCRVCTEANREHSEEYRRRRFAGNPLCAVRKCRHPQSRAYGNSLCYKHAREAIELRKKLDRMSRIRLKRAIARLRVNVKIQRGQSDNDIRDNIVKAWIKAQQ